MSFCTMFDATPTTVTHGSGVSPSKKRRRLPIGSSPGQYLRANNWLTIATGRARYDVGVGEFAPRQQRRSHVLKYAGLIFNADIVGRPAPPSDGAPASSYGSFAEPHDGSVSAVATSSTPGVAWRRAVSRS